MLLVVPGGWPRPVSASRLGLSAQSARLGCDANGDGAAVRVDGAEDVGGDAEDAAGYGRPPGALAGDDWAGYPVVCTCSAAAEIVLGLVDAAFGLVTQILSIFASVLDRISCVLLQAFDIHLLFHGLARLAKQAAEEFFDAVEHRLSPLTNWWGNSLVQRSN